MSLHLNWDLNTRAERISYLQTISIPNNPKDLEMAANYILWAENTPEENLDLPSHWKSSPNVESLDALLETPTFNEAEITSTPTKKKREVFSRS